jgi:hypothetical protein
LANAAIEYFDSIREVIAMSVDTKQIQGRRGVNFASYDDMLADVRDLASRPTTQLGNWSLGQICEHQAKAMNSAIDGAPFRAAWYIRIIGPLLKKRMISRPMSPGFKLPKDAVRLLPSETSNEAGIAALAKAVERLKQNQAREPHVVFGRMTCDEWDQLMLRHAEMHLSFIVPR